MILDTNALSALVDGDAAIAVILRSQSRVALPVIVLGEFRFGIASSRHKKAYETWLETHLDDFDVLAVTESTTRCYADIRVAQKRAGRPIPANDAWIAALAKEHELPVLSRDSHFDAVAGLVRATW